LELAGKEIDGRAVRVDLSTPRPPRGENGGGGRKEAPKSAPADTLFIGNLSFNASEDGLYELFGEHGDVSSIRIPTDRESGKPKG
jgi:nucleolin